MSSTSALSHFVPLFEQTLDIFVLACALSTLGYILIGSRLTQKRTQVQALIVWIVSLIIVSSLGGFFQQHFVKNINNSIKIL
jgi:hypothetical protein